MTAGETHQAIEATFRIERARLIAGLARVVRNVDLVEELAQDTLVVALVEWLQTGVPANPGAWLMAVAKRRAVDAFRRDKMRERKHEEIARTLDETRDGAAEAIEAAMDDDLGDEPRAISPDGRVALTVASGASADVYIRRAGSTEPAEPLVKSSLVKHPNDWSADGKYLMYDEHTATARQDLWIVPMEGAHTPIPFLAKRRTKPRRRFRPTGSGSPTRRTNRAAAMSMCERSRPIAIRRRPTEK